MFDVSPISRKFKSQSLAKPSRNCSDASPTSVFSGAWRSKKCRSLRKPQHNFGPSSGLSRTLHRRSTEDTAAVPTAEDVHSVGSVAPHRGVIIAGRWRRPAQNGDFGPRRRLPTTVAGIPGFGDVRLDSKCQKTPQNSVQRLSFQKTWNQKLHHVSRPAFNLWMVNFRSWLDEMYRNVMSNFVQSTPTTQHTSSLANETPREFMRQTSA